MSAAPSPDLLAAIVAGTRRIVSVRQAAETRAALEARALARSPRGAAFQAALADPARLNIIAECKRRSPSRGVLRRDYDPVRIARAYEAAGAAAVSILTEPTFFDGALDHLAAVREAVAVPLLRKDFLVDEYQLLEARACGADAVLLVVAALPDEALRRLHGLSAQLDLAALVEVHDVTELERALAAGARIVGVNNRNLHTLAVDRRASDAVAERLPAGIVAVSESGLRTRQEMLSLQRAGFHAFLIGERFMTAPDPGDALREVLSPS